MIQNGDTHVSASVPSGKLTPHVTYYEKREGSVMGKFVPSLGELEADTKPITLNTPLAGTHNERATRQTAEPSCFSGRSAIVCFAQDRESWFNDPLV
jgi:hypothetical protein